MPSSFDPLEESLTRLAERREIPLESVILLRLIHHLNDAAIVRLRTLLKPFGLNDWSMRTLLMLQAGRDQKLSIAELTQITGDTAPNMTRVADELVKRGWATRTTSTQDRRKAYLKITPKALRLLDKAAPQAWGRLEWFMSALDDNEKAVLKRLLLKLVARADGDTGESSEKIWGAPQRSGKGDAT